MKEAIHISLFVANKQANKQKPSEASALKARLSLNNALFPKLQHLFHTVHAINIKGRSHNDYKWLGELDVAKGLDSGNHYRNCFTCQEFTSAIADVQQAEIKKSLANSKFPSAIVDGSIDSSITENEMVYLQSCQYSAVKTTLIRCCQVERGTASGILKAIETYL